MPALALITIILSTIKFKKMKTKIIMAVMGMFFALANVSYAGSFNASLPDCCKKQEACCAKNAACCKGQEVSKSLNDCCEQNKECCESAKACCDNKVSSGKVSSDYKHPYNEKAKQVSNVNSSHKNHKASCCN